MKLLVAAGILLAGGAMILLAGGLRRRSERSSIWALSMGIEDGGRPVPLKTMISAFLPTWLRIAGAFLVVAGGALLIQLSWSLGD
ncbi:MAG TPA: hypothetical protein VGC46_01235 [Allosphingosinicella sp.]